MKIAIFTDTFPPQVNGVAHTAYLSAKNLIASGHTVAVFTVAKKPKDRPDISLENLQVFRLPSLPALVYPGERFTLPIGITLWQMKKFNPSVIHLHTPFSVGWEAVLMSKILKIPLVGTHHTFYNHYLKHVKLDFEWMKKISWKFTIGFYNHCDLILSPSNSLADELIKEGLERSIGVLQNSIDINLFKPLENQTAGEEVKKFFGVKNRSVCYMGRLSYEKSIDQVIRAFALINKKMPDLNLMIIGDGPERKNLEKLAKDLNVNNSVIFTGSLLYNGNLVKALQANDLFISASKSENMPLSILEAMAVGLPMVLVKEKGLAELIQENVNGIFARTDDPADIAEKVLFLLSNTDLLNKFSQGSRQMAMEYSNGKVTDLLMKSYEKTIEEYLARKNN
ncbi:glycosyltransferase [Patescibacteria group bacterium]|nr:glycosyltransferase [Patescibacteria group bacterium]